MLTASVRSASELRPCADRHLADYLDPAGRRAYWTYDQPSDPDRLTALDCLAPMLLSLRPTYEHVVPLFQPSGPHAELRRQMEAVLALPPADFLDLDLGDPDGGPEHGWRGDSRRSANKSQQASRGGCERRETGASGKRGPTVAGLEGLKQAVAGDAANETIRSGTQNLTSDRNDAPAFPPDPPDCHTRTKKCRWAEAGAWPSYD